MQDIPPEIAVATEVVKSLTASGRCREDARLYEAAATVLREYLESAATPRTPEATPTVRR